MADDLLENYCNGLLRDDSSLDWGRSEEDGEQQIDQSSSF